LRRGTLIAGGEEAGEPCAGESQARIDGDRRKLAGGRNQGQSAIPLDARLPSPTQPLLDFVVGFEHRKDAERFWAELRDTLAQFGLELMPRARG
jgi:hypothetical protein